MKTPRVPVATLMLVALVAAPAGASHGGMHPTFKANSVYLHCSGPTKVYQVNWAASIGNASSYVPWDATPPAQSVQAGAGCGGVDWGGTTNALYDVALSGTFKGNLRDMTINLYSLLIDNARQTSTAALRMYGEIDGKAIFPPGAQPNNGRTVTLTPVRSSSGASDRYTFSITNLGYARDVFDTNGELIDVETGGVALEDGDGEAEHTLLLYIGLHGTAFGQDPNGHKVGTWAWDTTEVPAGITFNPTSLAAAQVAANLPVFD